MKLQLLISGRISCQDLDLGPGGSSERKQSYASYVDVRARLRAGAEKAAAVHDHDLRM